MTIQHSAIPDAQLHEPKGIATAAVNKVYVANGAGSGTWNHNVSSVHGSMYLAGAAVSVGPTGGTITADADYRLIGPTWTLNTDVTNITLHSSNAGLQLAVSGHYYISAFVSFNTGAVAAATKYALKYRVNGSATLSTQRIVSQKVSNGVDSIFLAGSTFFTFSAGDYIQLMLASSVADTVTTVDASFNLFLLNPT